MSFAIPIGLEIDRSASSSVMQVGVRSGSESFSQTENGIRLMLAPRSANAKHSSIPGNSQGIRNLPGSPSFLGNLFKMTADDKLLRVIESYTVINFLDMLGQSIYDNMYGL
ncbi:hypothetical protein Tco_1048598, partial [Tanacetum coccineum]